MNWRGNDMDNKAIKKLETDLWESADLLRAGSKLTSANVKQNLTSLGKHFLPRTVSRI